MRIVPRLVRALVVLSVFGLASYFALQFGTGGLWRGLEVAHAVTSPGQPKAPYDLTQLVAVNETLNTIRTKYVDPSRVKPRQMFLSAVNQIQKEVAQVIVLHEEKSNTVKVQVDSESASFRIDNVQGPWDVAARLREVFAFLQANLKDTEVDLRDVEYAACNGMLRTLDPHSVFLSPEAYREMNLTTSGHFGGLGIVISVRDQQLTVMRPMPGTPAGRANLKRLDRITKINNESTLNMPLDDAVNRLRGNPGSKVTIWVHRDGTDGWTGARPFELVREEIQVKSVDYRGLGNGVGYVRLKQFQASTSDELDEALADLHKKEKLKALVLDLRGNPGGLLDQAARVADRFLEDGVIVATVGASEGREEKRAVRKGTEPNYPIVVLVNGSSASASEIVAGALKNLDRAVIVGQTTFGKGSVQLVFPHVTPENAALKLTIAQYLTPGDVSIQGVGVAPDIELDPMTADTVEMDLYRNDHGLRERDLTKSLSNTAHRATDQPEDRLRYNLPEKERAEIRDRGGDLEDEFELDFPIKIARDLAGRLNPGKRLDQVRSAKDFLDKLQQTELDSVSADLGKIGIDWAAPPKDYPNPPKASDYEVKVSTDHPNDTFAAGEQVMMKISVKNKSTSPAYQVRASTKSDGGYYDEKEFVFGKIMPGETKTETAPLGFCDVEGHKPGSSAPTPDNAKRVCKIPLEADARADVVKVRFFAEGAEPPPDAELRPTLNALPQPIFAYNYQIVDNRPGNGDGQLSKGEGATVYLAVKNVGKGKSYETQANIRNLTGDGLLIHNGRFDISNMKPGEVRNVAFTFDVLDELNDSNVNFELSVADRELRVVSTEKVTLPIAKSPLALNKAQGKVSFSAAAPVRGQPLAAAAIVGEVDKGSVLDKLGTSGTFTKVNLGDDRFGFVETKSLHDNATAAGKIGYKPRLSHSPPLLEVTPAKLATREDKVHIEGIATDGDRVLDGFIFVGPRKVFYQSNRKAPDPTKLKFSIDTELQPGINVITVVARESDDSATRTTMIVRRDGPNGEPLPSPKGESAGEDWSISGDGD
ncbi:MAG TPA: MXAN_5808 family serine peptidase [Polyangiaceae bacterium]|jgi:carboxyl-terminal processing protease|nr:MXAN_5808 family serine peptidase [Polyangiaceae bacterium]